MEGCRPPKPLRIDEDLPNNWRKFIQAFEIFMMASGKDKVLEPVKIAIFLNCIGEDALDLYNTLKISDDDRKSLEKIKEAFEKYIKPRRNVIYERYVFYNRAQGSTEPIDNFVTDLKKLVKTCEFVNEEEMIRDRIVLGIHNTTRRKSYCEK